jgi:ParB family transcriptional regulator, chromosome partitioning protein
MGHGRAIINVEDLDIQAQMYQKIVSQNLSVRETETLVKNYQESLLPKSNTPSKSAGFEIDDEQQHSFNSYFGTKVDLKVAGNGKGKITIPFHSQEDLNRIIKLIKG